MLSPNQRFNWGFDKSLFLSLIQMLPGGEKCNYSVNYMHMKPLLHFLCYKVSPLFRSNVKGNILWVHRLQIAEPLVAVKTNPFTETMSVRFNLYSIILYLLPDSWLLHSRKWSHSRKSWFQGADSSVSQVILGKEKTILLTCMHHFLSYHHGHLVHEQTVRWLKEEAD